MKTTFPRCIAVGCLLTTVVSLLAPDTRASSVDAGSSTTQTFQATELVLASLRQPVLIEVVETAAGITVSDSADTLLSVSADGQQLVLSGSMDGEDSQAILALSVREGHGVIIQYAGDVDSKVSQIVSPKDSELVRIGVPVGVPLRITDQRGDLDITGMAATVDYQGSGTLAIEHAGRLDLRLAGNAKVVVGQIEHALNLQGSGNSRVIVRSGVPVATVGLKGNARLAVTGEIDVLTFNGAGNARLAASQVARIESQEVRGNARLKIVY